jgi:hypothetical protein
MLYLSFFILSPFLLGIKDKNFISIYMSSELGFFIRIYLGMFLAGLTTHLDPGVQKRLLKKFSGILS